jgi:hypothetical protein
MAAGSLWCENDGLFLYVPRLAAASSLIDWRKIAYFLGGLATITPWLIFNSSYGLRMTTGDTSLCWHPHAPRLLWNGLVTQPHERHSLDSRPHVRDLLWTCNVRE